LYNEKQKNSLTKKTLIPLVFYLIPLMVKVIEHMFNFW